MSDMNDQASKIETEPHFVRVQRMMDGEDLISDVPVEVQTDADDPLNDEFPDEIPLEEYTVTQAMKALGTCRSNVMGMIARGTLRARKPMCAKTGLEIDEWRILRMDVDAQTHKRAAQALRTLEAILGPGKWVTSLRAKAEAGLEVAQVGGE